MGNGYPGPTFDQWDGLPGEMEEAVMLTESGSPPESRGRASQAEYHAWLRIQGDSGQQLRKRCSPVAGRQLPTPKSVQREAGSPSRRDVIAEILA